MFKRFKGLFLFVMLLSVSARVFTGASEAQVNFTSLIVDQHLITHNSVSEHNLLHNSVIKSTEGAETIPDKHRTYATYKKYITPDKSLSVDLAVTQRKSVRASAVRFINLNRVHSSIYLSSTFQLSSCSRVCALTYTHDYNRYTGGYGE